MYQLEMPQDVHYSMDSTLKSDLTVGPPIDFVVYKKMNIKLHHKNV